VRILLISADPAVREAMAVVTRSVARAQGEAPEFFESSDGVKALRLASQVHPDIVVADEITSRAGAFAVASDLKGATLPFAGRVIVFLDRKQDAWLAAWSGADAWFTKPIDPFEVAERIQSLFREGQKEAV